MKNLLCVLLLSLCLPANAQLRAWKISPNASIEDFPAKREVNPHLKAVEVMDVVYKSSDGLSIKGFVIRPVDTLKKYPVIIFNRGGNGSFGMVEEPFIVRFLSKIAAQGFVVAGSQLRGSEGSEGIDEFGGRTTGDVLALLDGVLQYQWADAGRIAQLGWSRGAITNFQLLKVRPDIKATITIAGQSDVLDTNRKIMFTVYRNRIPGYEKDSVAAARNISPLYQLDRIQNKDCALLFIHGDADDRVPVAHGRQMHQAATALRLKSELWEYPGGDHSLRKWFDELSLKIAAWLRRAVY